MIVHMVINQISQLIASVFLCEFKIVMYDVIITVWLIACVFLCEFKIVTYDI